MQGINLSNETKVGLLFALKDFTELATKDIQLPVKFQSQDEKEPPPKTAAVYLARLRIWLRTRKKPRSFCIRQ